MKHEDMFSILDKKWNGKKIRVKPDSKHPHAGREGIFVCFEDAKFPCMKIKTDNGYTLIPMTDKSDIEIIE